MRWPSRGVSLAILRAIATAGLVVPCDRPLKRTLHAGAGDGSDARRGTVGREDGNRMAAPALEAQGWLDLLVGRWELTGQMGATPLRQAVEGRWILGHHFVEVTCRSVLPVPAGQ